MRTHHSASAFHVRMPVNIKEREVPPRVNPHLQYQHFPKELWHQQQRQFQVPNDKEAIIIVLVMLRFNIFLLQGMVVGVHSRSDHENNHGYTFDHSSPFNFQHLSPVPTKCTNRYLGEMPAKDYPLANQPRVIYCCRSQVTWIMIILSFQISAQPSNYNATAFGQLSTWPQFS